MNKKEAIIKFLLAQGLSEEMAKEDMILYSKYNMIDFVYSQLFEQK